MSDGETPPAPLPEELQRLLADAGRPAVPAGFSQKVLGRVKATAAAGPLAASALGKLGVVSSVAAAVVGAGLGALVVLKAYPTVIAVPVPMTVVVERRVEVPVPVVEPAPVEPRAPPKPPPPHARDADLAQERVLIEMARSALARRDLPHAFEALESHAAKFRDGQLAEDRESLWVQALATSGRLDEAKKRAAEFRARYPNSLALPAVDAALEPAP